ncbi:MAG: phosphotransferase [Porticoccus sp.]
MASFITSDINNLQVFLSQYSLGDAEQIEATYTARTHHTCRFQLKCANSSAPSPYLLVVVEPAAEERLVFSSALIEHLHNRGIPVTPCLSNNKNNYISLFGDSPALLYKLPEGQPPRQTNLVFCKEIGAFLGKMHAKSQNFSLSYGNPRSLVWLNLATEELLPQLATGDAALLTEQLSRFKHTIDSNPNLPCGPLIGSLFADQLFFQGETLEAVTGFYFSCTDWLLFDVAQAVNEWCCDEHGELDRQLTKALLCAYHAERPFTPCEEQYWQDILCFSATRFWVSRLLTSLPSEKSSAPSVVHDPSEYKQKLQRRITGYHPLPC